MLGDNEFVCGNMFTMADIIAGHILSWAKGSKLAIPQDNVAEYIKRILARPPTKKHGKMKTLICQRSANYRHHTTIIKNDKEPFKAHKQGNTMKAFKTLLISGAVALALGTVSVTAHEHNAPKAQATAKQELKTEHDKLFALFAAADERDIELNPIMAIFRGDMRYADKIGDFFTDSHALAGRTATLLNLSELKHIDRSQLSDVDKLAYDVFKYNEERSLQMSSDEIEALTEVRPVNHFSGFHTFYPTFASGKGAAPFKTVEDYENNLARHEEYIAISDRSIDKFREGMESGVVETKLTIDRVIKQLDTQLAIPLKESQFWGPINMFPESFSSDEKHA